MVRPCRGRRVLGPGPRAARPRPGPGCPDVAGRHGRRAARAARGSRSHGAGPAGAVRRGHRRGRGTHRRAHLRPLLLSRRPGLLLRPGFLLRSPLPFRRRARGSRPGGGAVSAPPAPWCTDPYADALRIGRGPLYLRRQDGWLLPLEVERWCARADSADMSVLRRCTGAVLDIGCGPGRLVAALAALGHPVLGIDPSPAAVARTRGLGGTALRRSVFERLPGEGRWSSALLLDGNIGIGGDPVALLTRVAELLAPGGLLLVEAAADEVEETVEVRLDDGSGGRGPAFPWARLGRKALRARAREAGWSVLDEWSGGELSPHQLRPHEPPNHEP
ncbi:class I SAM-dependent methyltransferase, partial [Streptomyces daliensis]|nr:class I SAM-dependent methyltransferase [Streptomyces daliensis]